MRSHRPVSVVSVAGLVLAIGYGTLTAAGDEPLGRCVSPVTRDGHYVVVTALRDSAAERSVIIEASPHRRVPLKEGSPIDDPAFGVEHIFRPTATVTGLSLRGGTNDAPQIASSTPDRRRSLTLAERPAQTDWWSAMVSTSVGTMTCRLKVTPPRSDE